MKTRPERKLLQKLLVLGAAGLVLLPPTIFARGEAVNVASTLAHFQEHSVSAHVVLVADEISATTRMTEEYVARVGCHYEVRDQQSVAQLLQIVREGQIQEAGPDQRPFEVRTIVELTDSRGRKTKLVFEGVGDPLDGTLDGVPVKAAAAYHRALHKWATGRKPASAPYPGFCP